MSQPSMADAAKIRDVAARHAYVFDNGLSSPDFFDVEKRMASEEFGLLKERILPEEFVVEIGCFTGLNLIGLQRSGHRGPLLGVDFVGNACQWLREHGICALTQTFPFSSGFEGMDVAICFDVLEHQLNVLRFLEGVVVAAERSLFLVPAGREYYDCGHVAFFPDAECLRNVLDYVFDVEEIFELKTCKKLFASCRRRA